MKQKNETKLWIAIYVLALLLFIFIALVFIRNKIPLIDKQVTQTWEHMYCANIAAMTYCTTELNYERATYFACDIDIKWWERVTKLDTDNLFPDIRIKRTSVHTDVVVVERFKPESKTRYSWEHVCIPLYNYILNIWEPK